MLPCFIGRELKKGSNISQVDLSSLKITRKTEFPGKPKLRPSDGLRFSRQAF